MKSVSDTDTTAPSPKDCAALNDEKTCKKKDQKKVTKLCSGKMENPKKCIKLCDEKKKRLTANCKEAKTPPSVGS